MDSPNTRLAHRLRDLACTARSRIHYLAMAISYAVFRALLDAYGSSDVAATAVQLRQGIHG
ncbi:MAG: hypothetical protein AAF355_10705 [Myxococcota bacterium]